MRRGVSVTSAPPDRKRHLSAGVVDHEVTPVEIDLNTLAAQVQVQVRANETCRPQERHTPLVGKKNNPMCTSPPLGDRHAHTALSDEA